MNKQEMRRLGLLPYKEGEIQGWVSRPRRRRRRRPRIQEMTIERVEVQATTRRLRANWTMEPVEGITMISEEAVDNLTQIITDEIDQDIVEQVEVESNTEFDDWPQNEEIGEPEPRTFIQAMRRYFNRRNDDN